MRYRLISTTNDRSFELRTGRPLVVGRGYSSDIPIFDATISRRHAEVTCDEAGILIRDLGSSNGTFLNGSKVAAAHVVPGDVVSFGSVAFQLEPSPVPPLGPSNATTVPMRRRTPAGPTTIVRPVPTSGAPPPSVDRDRHRLALLLDVSKALGRAIDPDALLDRILSVAFEVLEADRAAILLAEGDQLVQRVARDKQGFDNERMVPQSIARVVAHERVAVLSENAPEDQRFAGDSIQAQRVRSAMGAPLLGGDGAVLGVLYVDNLSEPGRFSDEDLDFLVAFAGIAGVAIENGQYAERLRREAVVRSNYERFFAPALAERIAASPEAVTLGGTRCSVAVLFSDIRGFTALSEHLPPDRLATLLSEYFGEMVECVFRHGGSLDKFMGDAILAHWGAPVSAPDDANRAVRAAVDMMATLRTLNGRWAARGGPHLDIGVGLNYGDAFAGNIGSARRLEFTIIGDTVNTASRLCAAASPGEILVSEDMRRALGEAVPLDARLAVELKGKREPVQVYCVAR